MKVLVLEDHPPSLEAIVTLLRRLDGWDIRGAESLESAAAKVDEWAPDAALVDLRLGGESGTDAIRWLTEEKGTPCLALTIADDEGTVRSALRAGAVGYLLKDDPFDRICDALGDAVRGGHPISSSVAHHLFPQKRARAHIARAGLTERETQVLVALARGLSYAECANSLGCALGTVQSHVKKIYGKLDVTSKTEASAWAMSVGLVE